MPHTPVLRVPFGLTLAATNYASALLARTIPAIPLARLTRTSVLLRIFPIVTFPPHLLCNSPRLNDLANRSNEYLRSKRFLLTTAPIRTMVARVISNKPATQQHP